MKKIAPHHREKMATWLAIIGRPSDEQASQRHQEELKEEAAARAKLMKDPSNQALKEDWLSEVADVAFTSLQLAMLGIGNGDLQQVEAMLDDAGGWPAFEKTLDSNLTKVTPCWQLSRQAAQDHAKSLVSNRYPATEALPIDAGTHGRFWVWKCTAGPDAGKVLKGPGYES